MKAFYSVFIFLFLAQATEVRSQCSTTPVVEAVRNGDFELGYLPGSTIGAPVNSHTFTPGSDLDFSSDLRYSGRWSGPSSTCHYGMGDQYGVGRVEGPACPFGGQQIVYGQYTGANRYRDHTLGTNKGFAMFVDFNHNTSGYETVWAQTVDIFPSQQYYFSAWFAQYGGNQAAPTLRFRVVAYDAGGTVIENVPVGTAPVASPSMVWQQFNGVYNSPANAVTARIFIECNSTGNPNQDDFMIDDISFINGCQNIASQINYTIDFANDASSLCYNNGSINAQILKDDGTNLGGGKTITWYEGTGTSQTELTAFANQEAPNLTTTGTYRACVIDPANSGCTVNATIDINKNLNVNLPANIDLCKPAEVTLDDGRTEAGLTHTWNVPSGITPSTNNSQVASVAGNYEVTVELPSVSGCSATDNTNVTSSLPSPTLADYCVGDPAILEVGSGKWTWMEDDKSTIIGVESGGTPVSWTGAPSIPGTYQVSVKDGSTTPLATIANQGWKYEGDGTNMTINVTEAVILKSAQVRLAGWAGTRNITIQIRGAMSQNIVRSVNGTRTINLNVELQPGVYTIGYNAPGETMITGPGPSGSIPGYVTVSANGGKGSLRALRFEALNACDPILVDVTAKNCCVEPTIDAQPTNQTVCEGATANFSISSSSPSPSYEWEISSDAGATWAVASGSGFTGVNTGNLTVDATIARDGLQLRAKVTAASCPLYSDTVTLNINPLPTITGTIDAARCGDGTVNLSATSSAGTIDWFAASTGGSSLFSGSNYTTTSISSTTAYYVQATDNGCVSASRTAVNATINTLPTASITTSGTGLEYCNGGSGVTLTAQNVSGATYIWSKDGSVEGTGNPYNNALAGDWTVEVTDGNTCQATSNPVTVIENSAVTANITTSGTDLEYCNTTTGTTLTAQNIPGATYEWSKGGIAQGTGNPYNNADAGSWTVEVTDANLCSATSSPVTVQDVVCVCPESASLTITGGSPSAVCVQGDVTTTDITITFYDGGTGATNYSFDIMKDGLSIQSVSNHDGSPFNLTSQPYGDYTLSGFTGTCSGTVNTLRVDSIESPTATITAIDDTLCSGVDNADIQLTGVLGTGPWDVTVNGNVSTVNPTTNLTPSSGGLYSISEIKDANGCTSSSVAGLEVTIGEVTPPTGNIISPINFSSGSSANHTFNPASLSIESTAPASGYTGQWAVTPIVGSATLGSSSSSETNSIEGMSFDDQASVTWTISDVGNECPSVTATLIVDRKDITVALVTPDELCQDFTGYTLVGNGLLAGETGSWSVSSLSSVTGLTITPVAGTNGKEATVSGYALTPGIAHEEIIFEYEVTPNVGSPSTDTMMVTVYAHPIADPGIDETICGDSYQLKAPAITTGSGLWSDNHGTINYDDNTLNNATASNLPSGSPGSPVDIIFTLQVTNGVCTPASNDVTITRSGDLTSPNASIVGGVSQLCVTSPTGVDLTGNAPEAANSETSNWTVSPIVGVILTTTNDDPNASATFTAAGTYTFTYTIDNPTCNASTSTVSVDVIEEATISSATIDQGCEGSDVQASASGISTSTETLSWSSISGTTLSGAGDQATTTFTLATDGTTASQVSVTPSNSVCGAGTSVIASNTIDLKPRETPDITAASGSFSICESGSDSYTASNATETGITGYDWTWEGNAQASNVSILNLTSSDYAQVPTGSPRTGTITITPINNCGAGNGSAIASQNIDIITAGPITVDLASEVNSISTNQFCIPEDQVVFNASSVEGEAGGLVPDFQFSVDGNIVQSFSPSKQYTATIGELSDGQVVMIEVKGAAGGCYTTSTNSTTITVDGYNQPNITLTSTADEICESNGNITLNIVGLAKGDQVDTWSIDGATISGHTSDTYEAISAASRGNYEVVVSNDVCDATATESKAIMIYEQPTIQPFTFVDGDNRLVVNIENSGQIQTLNYAVQVSGLSSDLGVSDDYTWTSTNFNPTQGQSDLEVDIEEETNGDEFIKLIVTNGSGLASCSDEQGFYLSVSLPLEIPNAFTPNGDGNNDKWVIQGMNEFPNAEVVVFNRWGSPVYKNYGIYSSDNAWDGSDLPIATYYYIIKLDSSSDDAKTLSGSITIVR